MNKLLKIIIITVITVNASFYSAFSQLENLPSDKKQEIEQLIAEGKQYFNNSNFNEATRCYNRAAYLLWTNNCFKEATTYYTISLDINEKLGKQNAIKVISSNLGLIYSDLEDYANSFKYFNKSLEIKRKEGNKLEIASELLNVAHVLKYMNRLEEANEKLLESVNISKEFNEMKLMKRAYGMLAENYETLGNSEKSFEYFNLFSSLDNYLKQQQIKETEEKTKQQIKEMQGVTQQVIQEKQATEKELRTAEDSLKNTSDSLRKVEAISLERQLQIDLLSKEKQLQDLKVKRQKTINLFVFVAAILLGIIAFILFRGYKQKQRSNALLTAQNKEILRQKEEINKQNINITNSINYARRIQNAILPPIQDLEYFVPESFVLFKPRDIVSGDFYWFSDLELNIIISRKEKKKKGLAANIDKNKFIISAIDCTGHGVPGALMSMISYNLLYNTISSGITKPSEILDHLHTGIITGLKQSEKSEVQDGMDLSLCFVDKKNKKIEFAGAKNPIVYIKNGNLYRIKGDNQSIGGQIFNDNERIFTNHEIEIDGPLTVYLFSDGFPDQLGGEEGKKYLFINFKKLLLDIYPLPFTKQKEILENKLEEWRKGQFAQLDDVLVIGFKID